MSDTITKFQPKITNVEQVDGELKFMLSGDDKYGFDKSIVNGIRRVLLTDIPTVAFNLSESGVDNDIIIVTNNSALHNEMMTHRIALIPLYLNPENYTRKHLFECKVVHDSDDPFRFVTMNDVSIYPLKVGIQERLDKYYDDSYDLSPEDSSVLNEQLSTVNIDNYDMNKPLSQKEKDKIYRPFMFRKNTHYSMLTELKSTNTEDSFQELNFYGSPSVGYGYQDAKYQGVSQATYSFTVDDKLVKSVLKEKLKVEEIEKKNVKSYSRKFMLAESERYFHRDNSGEANRYNFSVKSNHYYDSGTIFKKAIEILIGKFLSLKMEFIELLKENNSRISVDQVKENVYHYEIENESHTLGNIIQSHIVRHVIKDGSLINLCGYKKPHPLEDKILIIVSLNNGHKAAKQDELSKLQNMTTALVDAIDSIVKDLRVLDKVTEKIF